MTGPIPAAEGRSGRERCPTCGAARREAESECYRCRSDLRPLLEIERQADAWRAEARRCYGRGWYRRAAAILREVLSLEARPEDLRLLAAACLWFGDYATAYRTFRRLRSLET